MHYKVRTLTNIDSGLVFDPYRPSLQRASTSKYRHFLVTSWGHAASIWFAGSLNFHEAVLCNVGQDHPLQSFNAHWLNVDGKAHFERSTPESWRYGAILPEPVTDGSKLRGYDLPAFSVPPRDYAKIPWFVFDEMETVARNTSARVIGNVHGMWLETAAKALAVDPGVFGYRRFPLVNLIRHPVGRTESAIKATHHYTLSRLEPEIDRLIDEQIDDIRDIERKFGVDFTEPRARASLHVFRQGHQNTVWSDELKGFPRVRMVLMEKLQESPEYFAAVFDELTGGALEADKAFLDKVFLPENLGGGRQGGKPAGRPLESRLQFEEWSAFERAEFRRLADTLKLRELYEAQGYDMSFV